MSRKDSKPQSREKYKKHKVSSKSKEASTGSDMPKEYGGPKGPEPTRYGDWESKGKCIDF